MQLYALGEITYDIIFKDGKPIDSKVGGSVLNTAVSSARLGMPVTMVATCATDEIGLITQKYLTTNGINTKSITVYKGTSRIALAFLDEQNNAKYSFYNGLNYEELKLSFPTSTENGFVLFGSSFGINPQIRTDLVKYLKRAKESGNLIYYDPNFRPSQLIGNDSAKEWIIENIRMADIVKGSNEVLPS